MRTLFRLALVLMVFGSFMADVFAWQDRIPNRRQAEVPKLNEASADATTAIGSFKKPLGFDCQLFASEPMVGNPVSFTIDNRGRVVVCESYRQGKGVTDNRGHDEKWVSADLAAMTVADRIRYHREQLGDKAIEYETQDDLLRLLVDTNGDYRADQSTVFASGFNGLEEGTGAGALVRDNRIYYTNIPKLWALVDKDNDGVADERIVLADGFGVRVAFRGHDMHGLILGPDGRLYFSIGDRGYHVETPNGLLANPESGAVFRCELDGSNLEVFATGLRNPQELAFDDFGNLFTGDNNSDSGDKARWVYVVRGGDSGWRMMYQYISDRGPFNRERIWYPFSENTPAYTVPPIANVSDGPSGLACYPGTGFTPPDGDESRFANAFFLCDFRGQASNSGVRLLKVKPKGAFFEMAANEEFIWNVLVTDVEFAPDGGMYISDWVNGWNGENKGRIYRFADEKAQETEIVRDVRLLLSDGMKERKASQLAELLSHPDRRVRLESQWELAARQDFQSFIGALHSPNASSITKLHCVWGLGQILRQGKKDASVGKVLEGMLSDADPIVVARTIEMLADAKFTNAVPQIASLLSHESAIVKAAGCMALEAMGDAGSMPAVIKVLAENNNQDPILRHAGIMALSGIKDSSKLAPLTSHASEAVRVAAVVALRKQANPIIAEFLNDSSPKVQKEAVRAIHDVPALHSQLSSLAELNLSSDAEDAVVSRVLNASFRLGRKADALRLANFAAQADGRDSMRIEALSMLAAWGTPGNRDRIMNRHQPLPNRDVGIVTQAIRQRIEELSAAPTKVRDKFIEVGAKLGITEISKLILKTAQDTSAEGVRRAAAIRALASLDPDSIRSSISAWLKDENTDVRIASLGAQVSLDPDAGIASLKQAIHSQQTRERQFAWDQLGTLTSPEAKALLSQGIQSYLAGKLPRDSWINVLEAAEGKLDAQLQAALKEKMKGLDAIKESAPKQYYEDSIDGGDVDRGRILFFTRSSLSCVRCHKVGSTGGEVGPNLSDLGAKKDRSYLLEAIVAPNEVVAQGFETMVILDDDGNTSTGILKSETEDEVTLMDAQGGMIKIEKSAIEARRKGSSSMPADLMKYMNKRELRDLVAYLSSLDGTPTAVAGLNESQGGHKLE